MKDLFHNSIFNKFRFAPRWAIYTLDLFCVIIAVVVSFLLRFNFDLIKINEYNLLSIFLVTLIINATILFLFKAYKGIVRYTTLEDAGRLLVVNLIASFSLLIINVIVIIFYNFKKEVFIPTSVILIFFFAVSFFQIAYRLIVKRLFAFLFNGRRKTEKAVIFNTRNEGRLAKKLIDENIRSKLKIVAFLEDNYKAIGKKIENIPVLKLSKYNLKKLKESGVSLVIIADPYIRKSLLNKIVDNCLEFELRVQQLPSTYDWMQNKLDENQLRDIKIEQLLDRAEIHMDNAEISNDLKGKKVMVTGAAGSIGSEIVRQVLLLQPTLLIAVDNAETPLHILKLSLSEYNNVIYFIGNITDRVRMEQIFEIYEPEIVYHAAAYKHVPLMEENPSVAIINNVKGTKNLAELSVEYNASKFVMVSTDKAVNPTNVMGASKRIAEIFTQSYFNHLLNMYERKEIRTITKFITTRFGNVLGSNGSVIPRFTEQLRKGGPLTVTHPEITRYFMTIPEACRLVLEAGVMGKGGEIFVFDMGSPVKIADLALKMIRLAGKIPEQDIKIKFIGLRPGEKLYEELLNNSENSLPTYHKKILIAKVREYDFALIYNQVDELIRLASHHTNLNTVAKMKEIVPEFISQNSIYQSLDK